MTSAMSPVTPKPAAEFSTLAMTKSSDSRSMSAGIARRAISRPGFPKMSPMNRTRMLAANRNADRRPAPLVETRHHHAQLAVAQRRRGALGVVGHVQADGARETAERALRDEKRRLTVLAPRWHLGPGDQQHILRNEDLEIGRGDARQIEQQLDGGIGFDDVEGRGALGGRRAGVEESNEIGGKIASFEIDTGHARILALPRKAPKKRPEDGSGRSISQ